jgi:hypothetical protein
VALCQSLHHPAYIVADSALPSVFESPKLVAIVPYHLKTAVREERRVEVNQVHAVLREVLQNVLAIATIDCIGLKAHAGRIVRHNLVTNSGNPHLFIGGMKAARYSTLETPSALADGNSDVLLPARRHGP